MLHSSQVLTEVVASLGGTSLHVKALDDIRSTHQVALGKNTKCKLESIIQRRSHMSDAT